GQPRRCSAVRRRPPEHHCRSHTLHQPETAPARSGGGPQPPSAARGRRPFPPNWPPAGPSARRTTNTSLSRTLFHRTIGYRSQMTTSPSTGSDLGVRLGRHVRVRVTCVPRGLGQRGQVILGPLRLSELTFVPYDLPPLRHGEPHRVLLAQVITVRFSSCGERTDHRRGVGVGIGKRGYGRVGTPGPRAPPHAPHDTHDSALRPVLAVGTRKTRVDGRHS